MSARNGDKSRFHRIRKQNIERRKRTFELLQAAAVRNGEALGRNPDVQASCFALAETAAWLKAADSTLGRMAWLSRLSQAEERDDDHRSHATSSFTATPTRRSANASESQREAMRCCQRAPAIAPTAPGIPTSAAAPGFTSPWAA